MGHPLTRSKDEKNQFHYASIRKEFNRTESFNIISRRVNSQQIAN